MAESCAADHAIFRLNGTLDKWTTLDLDELIQERIAGLLFANPTRINYYERYQEIIAAYNSEQQKLKEKIAALDHRTDKQETKAAVDNLICETLWAELPESYDEISISEYRQRIYEYVFTRYKEAA